ncbi:MAG: Ubiquinone/menaquinone biosynthesis C-methyltransferase UbiE [Oscillospiraceae bacterium]|jgi:ubiquinone/menaquinone biosynthesis C-methylase UbiE
MGEKNKIMQHSQITSLVLERTEKIDYSSVLNVGCGRGELLESLLSTHPHARTCGIDLSERKILFAAQKLGETAELTVGDAETLPYPDCSFDLLICGNSIQRCLNPARAINQFYRVLQAGGILILYGSGRISAKRLLAGAVSRYGVAAVRRHSPAEIRRVLERSAFRNFKWEVPFRNIFFAIGTK